MKLPENASRIAFYASPFVFFSSIYFSQTNKIKNFKRSVTINNLLVFIRNYFAAFSEVSLDYSHINHGKFQKMNSKFIKI